MELLVALLAVFAPLLLAAMLVAWLCERHDASRRRTLPGRRERVK
jgi:hypothetical protein